LAISLLSSHNQTACKQKLHKENIALNKVCSPQNTIDYLPLSIKVTSGSSELDFLTTENLTNLDPFFDVSMVNAWHAH